MSFLTVNSNECTFKCPFVASSYKIIFKIIFSRITKMSMLDLNFVLKLFRREQFDNDKENFYVCIFPKLGNFCIKEESINNLQNSRTFLWLMN